MCSKIGQGLVYRHRQCGKFLKVLVMGRALLGIFPQIFNGAFQACLWRVKRRANFLASMVGQGSHLARKAIEPMALQVEGGTSAGCSGLSVMTGGMKSRGCGTLIRLWRTRWVPLMGC